MCIENIFTTIAAPPAWTEAVDATTRKTKGEPPLLVTILNDGDFAAVTVPSNYGYVFL
jgi:hypothetical protein